MLLVKACGNGGATAASRPARTGRALRRLRGFPYFPPGRWPRTTGADRPSRPGGYCGATMTVYALLYVSKALLPETGAEAAVADIVVTSRQRNARLQVTGALLYSGAHFAQMLEGARASVEELMASIGRDPRHCEISIVREGPVARARFAHWRLAYAGPSSFVDRTIVQALDEMVAEPRRGDGLIRMLEAFTAG